MNEEVRSLLDQEPLEEYLERLTAYALRLMRQYYWRGERSGSVPGGKEAIDFALEAIEDVYKGIRTWNPKEQPDLLYYLKGVVKSKISNAVRGAENSDRRQTSDSPEPAQCDADDTFLWGFHQELADAPHLQQVVEAIIDGNCKREDIAETLGVPPSEITNRNKQLQRRMTAYRAKLNKGDG